MTQERVTQIITLAEFEDNPGLAVTQLGAYVELQGDLIHVSQMGVYVEVAQDELRVTQMGLYVELEEQESVPMPTHYAGETGGRAVYRKLPDAVEGYAFDPEHSWWSIVVPEVTENLITNPSFELGSDGYTISGWSASSVTTSLPIGATRGRYALSLTPDPVGAMGTVDYSFSVTPGPYTFSMDLYNTRPGTLVMMSIRSGSTPLRQHVFTCNWSGWRRIYITYVELSTGTRVARLTSPTNNVGSGNNLRTDGWQIEAKLYPTTYADGDMTGYYDRTPNESYAWRGARHASTSVRFARTGSGGKLVSFGDVVNFMTTGIVGLGMSPVELQSIQMSNGQEVPVDTRTMPRDFTVTGRIFGCSWADLSRKRSEFIKLVRPNNTPGHQHVPLRYQVLDSVGNPRGVPLEILCTYKEGLQGNNTNLFQESIGMQFHSSFSYVQEVIDSAAPISLYDELVNNGTLRRNYDGIYENLGSGDSDSLSLIHVVDWLEDGSPVYGGNFTALGGDAVSWLAYYYEGAWNAFGTGGPDDEVIALHTGKNLDGLVFAGGAFNGGDIDGYAAMWDGSSWTPIDTVGFNGEVWAIERAANGDVYFGGFFTNKGDTSDALISRIARYDPVADTLYPLANGFGDFGVMTIAAGNDGYVYVGGSFTIEGTSGAGTVTPHVTRYNIAADAMEGMGTGLNGSVFKLAFHDDGYLYAIGPFTRDGGDNYDVRGFARWNGIYWEEVFDMSALHDDMDDLKFAIDTRGVFWFYSNSAAFHDVPGLGTVYMFGWRNGIFYPPLFKRATGSLRGAQSMNFNDANEMLVGSPPSSGTLGVDDIVYVPAINEVEYYGDADASPEIVLQGAMKPWFIESFEVAAGIYFRDTLTTATAEEVRVQTGIVRQRVFSNSRPNMSRYINLGPTSMRSFRLMPGLNHIAVFCVDVVDPGFGAGEANGYMVWRNTYWGIDAGPTLS